MNGFVRDFTGFTDALYESSDFFHPLGHSDNPEPSEIADKVKEWEKDNQENSNNNTVGIAIGSTIAALAIGLSVGVLAKRNRDAKNALEDASLGSMSKDFQRPFGAEALRSPNNSYAPPGPLGIVIDTTAEGPMVHSLKPTSRLAGLLQPGDLVVGLDDIDTRGMTAATLTRLMAKRSQQAQRKITLLSARAPSEVGDCE